MMHAGAGASKFCFRQRRDGGREDGEERGGWQIGLEKEQDQQCGLGACNILSPFPGKILHTDLLRFAPAI